MCSKALKGLVLANSPGMLFGRQGQRNRDPAGFREAKEANSMASTQGGLVSFPPLKMDSPLPASNWFQPGEGLFNQKEPSWTEKV